MNKWITSKETPIYFFSPLCYRMGHKKRNQILMAEKNAAFSHDLLKIIL